MDYIKIRKILKNANIKLSDKDIFTTKSFERYLKSTSSDLYTKWNIKQDNLILSWDEDETMGDAFTKGNNIYINSASDIIKSQDSPIKKFQIHLGLYCHEIGHRLFTNFSTRKMYGKSILQGSWFPKEPDIKNDEELNLKKIRMQNYMKNPKKVGKLCSALLFLYDIVEDGRIEELMYSYCIDYGRLVNGLNTLREFQYNNMVFNEEDLDSQGRFYTLLNQIICYCKFGEFKGVNKYLHEVAPLIDEAINEISSVKVIDLVNKISIVLWGELESYLESFSDEILKETAKLKPLLSAEIIDDLYKNVELTSKVGDSDSIGISKENMILLKDKKDFIKINETEGIEIEVDGCSRFSSNLAKDENATKLKKISKENLSESKNSYGEESETFEEEFNKNVNYHQGRKDISDNNNPRNLNNKDINFHDSGESDISIDENNNSYDSNAAAKELLQLINEIAYKQEDKDLEYTLSRRLNKEARSISYGDIHKGIKINVHRPTFTEEDKKNYLRVSKPFIDIAQQAAKKVLPLLENEQSSDFSNYKYYGTKFNASSVVNRDFRYFGRKNPPNESPSLAVGLRIDESSSMASGNRVVAARAAAITLWEFCRICNIPVAVYGDTADISPLENVSIYSYSDFDKPDSSDCYRLMQIGPRSNNRDGIAIRLMAERLLTVEADIKLLFVISDGKPRALTDYTGNKAEEDMKNIISEYTRKGITFFAAAIGQDKEVIKHIYGGERFLDISNLNLLPNRISIILKNLL